MSSETYREFAYVGPKIPIKSSDIGEGQIRLSHFHPSLYVEFIKHGTHSHEGKNTLRIKLKDITPEIRESGKSHYVFIGNLLIQWGWDFIRGDGSNRALQQDMTFPISYTGIPRVLVSSIGYKSSSDPSGPGDTSAVVAATWDFNIYDTLVTIARVQLARRSINGADPGVFGSTNRYMFSWYSIGIF